MLKINIITLFPEVFEPYLKLLPYNKAISKGIVEINIFNLRKYAIDERGSVDDKPYGGGVGMLIRVEPVYDALKDVLSTQDPIKYIEDIKKSSNNEEMIILTSPKGNLFKQQTALEISNYKNLTFICGRYEGFDQRVEDLLTTHTYSIGDFVLGGGEIATMAMCESIIRLIPNVLEKKEAVELESFSNGTLEHPQYTRPEDFKGNKIPEILKSGNHKEILDWKLRNSKKI